MRNRKITDQEWMMEIAISTFLHLGGRHWIRSADEALNAP